MKALLTLLLFSLIALNLWAQNTNDVTLTVVGSGKTIEEAKTNALRSAIEQAYGAFVSSNTEILNDEIVKDEIVSISSGNIKEFKILSQSELLNDLVSMTLSATVSVSKLQSYAQSKGASIEFAGGAFAMNIKLQKLNEAAEKEAIYNLCQLTKERFKKCFEFQIQTTEPKYLEENQYILEYVITSKTNDNFKYALDYFIETLETIALKETELSNYKAINKPFYDILLPKQDAKHQNKIDLMAPVLRGNYDSDPYNDYIHFSFRNPSTIQRLKQFIIQSNIYPISFAIIRSDEKREPLLFGVSEKEQWFLFDLAAEYHKLYIGVPEKQRWIALNEVIQGRQQYGRWNKGYGFPAALMETPRIGYGIPDRSTSFGQLISNISAYPLCLYPSLIEKGECEYFNTIQSTPNQVSGFILSRSTSYEFTSLCREKLTLSELEKISEITVEPIYK